jgi:phosphoribosylformylglycinamidine synthase
MDAVREFAEKGGAVLGICNGFQVLCEAGLLPGALLLNSGQRFRCEDVFVRVESTRTPFTSFLGKGDVLRLPIAHGDGNWRAEAAAFEEVKANDQVVFRYCDVRGDSTPEANPNGSLDDVAGVCNRGRNVVGLMPHPERASEALLGNADGARLFRSFANGLLLGRTA